MIGCLRTRVRKQPIIELYSESKTVLKFYNPEASLFRLEPTFCVQVVAEALRILIVDSKDSDQTR